MLVKSQYQIVEKIIVSPEGIHFLATFLCCERAGKIKAKLLKVTPITDEKEITVALLNAPKSAKVSAYEKAISLCLEKIIPSPFQSLIYFTCSIPRGPNN